MTRNEQRRALRAQRRAAGLCPTCGKPAAPNRSQCRDCITSDNRRQSHLSRLHPEDPAFAGVQWDGDRLTIIGGERTADGRIVPVYRLPDGRRATVDLGRL